MELVSDFGAVEDPRRGTVHITNNQRSADPNRFLVLRTPGPVFYRDPKSAVGTPAAQGPDLWTDAAVDIVDRENLPRPVGSGAPVTVAGNTAETRTTAAVAEILAGRRATPPTVTAVGMRIYLEPDPPPGQPKAKKSGALSGVRRLEFLEQVVVNLWIDKGQSMVGGAPPPTDSPDAPPGNALALTPPPAAIVAVTGGVGTTAYAARLQNRALLQVDTRGPFAYDSEKSLARFDVVPHSDPNLPNDVQVTKIPATGGTTSLFSQVLELNLNGGPTAAARPSNAPMFKSMHAWTYTPGRILTVASQDDAMEAYGQDLKHDQATNATILTGSPLYVVKDRNVLSAGTAQRPATLTTESEPLPERPGGSGPPPVRKSRTTVAGPGRVELFDTASNANTLTATWLATMVQTKETIGGREQDLFTLTDDAKFEDTKAEYWLRGDILKLWLVPVADAGAPGATRPASGGQPKPSRVHAIGNVKSHSTDYDIVKTEQLQVFFSDPPAVPVAVVAAPVSPAPPTPVGPPAAATGQEPPVARPTGPKSPAAPPAVAAAPAVQGAVPKEPEKPKPPMKISAKTIDAWVSRQPVPAAPPKPGDKPPAKPEPGQPADAVRYQLDHANCDEDVVVHQDPTDPAKPRGVDILGRFLKIDGFPAGKVMTVFGWPTKPGEVHQEEMSLVGPEVLLDQVHNAASVKGRGALTMPSNSDLAGGDLAQPEVIVVHWRDFMSFRGAQRSAKFEGKVSAKQGESWILCHSMRVVFDRPVYFNQMQKKSAPPPNAVVPKANDPKGPPPDDNPKIETVNCYPAPADAGEDKRELTVVFNQLEYDKDRKLIKSQRLTAQEINVEAQARDSAGGVPYQRMNAFGPGVLRVWQAGDKDPAGPGPEGDKKPKPDGNAAAAAPKPPAGPAQPGAKPGPADGEEQEMKLTVVEFKGHLTAIDKAKVFQTATFENAIEAISIPAENPDIEVRRENLPPRAMFLKCADKLIVTSHKKANAPPEQTMTATGNAYIRSDEYDGLGEQIDHTGKQVILTGSGVLPAQIMNRFNAGNHQAGKKIVYDRTQGSYQVIESYGGTFGSSPKK